MKSLHRSLMAMFAIAIGVGLSGCKQEGDGTRNRVDVFSMNDNEPLLSDVYNSGVNPTDPADDFIPVDVVPVVFVSRLHDPTLGSISPGLPFGSVRFHTYEVVFGAVGGAGADLDGNGTVDLPNFGSSMSAYVPTDGFAETSVMIISGGQKSVPPISCLGPIGGTGCSGTAVEYATTATVTFYGTEETSGDDVTAVAAITIRIGNFSDR